MQAFTDLAYMMASHTQQLMSQEVYVDITGRWQDELQAVFGGETKAKVSPFDLLIDFDVIGSGASIPSGSMDLWTQMFKILAENQGLSQQFDMIRIFEYIAQLGGAKNVSDFRVRSKVMPNEQVLKQAQAGNIMPLSEAGGGYV
jgi:hypothetical protein